MGSTNIPGVRPLSILLLSCFWVAGCASTPKVVKVLPHFLDLDGRIALDPSLFERDAYQAYLRAHPLERNGVQFDIQWRAPAASSLKLRVEMRGTLSNHVTSAQLEVPLKTGGSLPRWSKTALTSGDYAKFGDLMAWRISLWNGETLLADQKSFLW